jgi:hypothetical protein
MLKHLNNLDPVGIGEGLHHFKESFHLYSLIFILSNILIGAIFVKKKMYGGRIPAMQ